MTDTSNFRSPRYWPTWLGIGLLQIWAYLPWKIQFQIARFMGTLAFYLARRRRHIVEVNLKLAFPEWSETERAKKVREVLLNSMIGLVETANAYHHPAKHFRDKTTFKGLDVLQQAMDQGRGVLLLGAHYSHLDLGGALVSLVCNPIAIYRPNNNPLMDEYIRKGRLGFMKSVILRSDMRGMARALKKNEVVWYPPDQDYGKSHSVYAPFFGVNAATITATSRLVKFNKSPVVVMSCCRSDREERYTVEFHRLDDPLPSGDDVKDATVINKAIETCIRKAPTQYMWTHRRFKTQPDGRGKFYEK